MSDAPKDRPVVFVNWKRMSFPLCSLGRADEIARPAILGQTDGNDLEDDEKG